MHLDAATTQARLIELMMRPDFPVCRAALELLAPTNPDAATALRVARALERVVARRRAALSHPAVQDALRTSRDEPVARDLLWLAERLRHEA